MLNGSEFEYSGELDKENLACGYGQAVNDVGETYKGTFFKDLPHGFCKPILIFLK